ncbi:hypothetical protein M231_06735 [Tremella mesenterica]|uniref:Uncharacterized protein n=1 Tax=Tremella mesenterica TaxID=5217 RepID=A0A4Q1BG25_TREME|nr:hypothetical protein M231_06735 [Tremella mesenterica]
MSPGPSHSGLAVEGGWSSDRSQNVHGDGRSEIESGTTGIEVHSQSGSPTKLHRISQIVIPPASPLDLVAYAASVTNASKSSAGPKAPRPLHNPLVTSTSTQTSPSTPSMPRDPSAALRMVNRPPWQPIVPNSATPDRSS